MKHKVNNHFLKFSVLLILTISTFLQFDKAYAIDAEETFAFIRERLNYMEDVALYKDKHSIPIEDKEREDEVLRNAITTAKINGLDPESIDDFFEAQIAVSKAIQYRYRADWLLDDSAGRRIPLDLKNTVRPKLITIGQNIISSIQIYLMNHGSFKEDDRNEFMQYMRVKNLSEREKNLLFDRLKNIKLNN